MTLSITPSDLEITVGDTAPVLRFHVTLDGTTPVDLSQCSVFFYLRRYGSRTNLFADGQSVCTPRPNPQTTKAAITLSGSGQSVLVTSSAGLGAGNYVLIDSGAAAETLVVSAVADATHFTAIFAQNHLTGVPFSLIRPALYPVLGANVSVGATQSVLVSDSSYLGIGNRLLVGLNTVNAEVVVVSAIVDATHFTASFTKTHALGDLVDFADPVSDNAQHGHAGYADYVLPTSGITAATKYLGQLKVVYPDGSLQHSAFVTVTTAAGL